MKRCRALLTNYFGALPSDKLEAVNTAIRIALAIG
jgi:hypothetical protein